jgi:hypothetical protein
MGKPDRHPTSPGLPALARTPSTRCATPRRKAEKSQRRTLSDKVEARLVKQAAEDARLDAAKFSGHSLPHGLFSAGADTSAKLTALMHQSRDRPAQGMLDYLKRSDLWPSNATKRGTSQDRQQERQRSGISKNGGRRCGFGSRRFQRAKPARHGRQRALGRSAGRGREGEIPASHARRVHWTARPAAHPRARPTNRSFRNLTRRAGRSIGRGVAAGTRRTVW